MHRNAKRPAPLDQKLALSINEAMSLSGFSYAILKDAINRGELIARRHGRRIFILPNELQLWLETQPTVGEEMATQEPAR